MNKDLHQNGKLTINRAIDSVAAEIKRDNLPSEKNKLKNFGMTHLQISILVSMTILLCLLIAGFVGIIIYTNQPRSTIAPVVLLSTETSLETTLTSSHVSSSTHTPNPTATKAPTRTPTIKPTETEIPSPTERPFFPVLPPVDINNQNYPEIYSPPYLIQNPEAYRNQRFRVTLFVTKILNTTIGGEEQWIISLSTRKVNSPYLPVLVFGLRSNYPYSSDPEVGNMVTVYGIGMGGVDRQTLDNLFGEYWILPSELYITDTNWIVACILGEAYSIVRR